jgi:hypothetical protein
MVKTRSVNLTCFVGVLAVIGLATTATHAAAGTSGKGQGGKNATMTLAWDSPGGNLDGSPLTDLVGYRVYYGTSPHTYTTVTNVGVGATVVLKGLQQGKTYYIAAAALNSAAAEGELSHEFTFTVPTAASNTDADGNGMPDAWEQLHFGDPNARMAGALDDPDQDGVVNAGEYAAGTDPNDGESTPSVSIALENGQVVVTFQAIMPSGPGYDGMSRYYVLEQRDAAPDGIWFPVQSRERVAAANQVVRCLAAPRVFYRTRIWLE